MSITDSMLVAITIMSIVFLCLVILNFLVRIQSYILKRFIKTQNADIKSQQIIINNDPKEEKPQIATGELKLIDVNEETAAMIMAILSHEIDIPLEELNFKSIRLLK